MVERLILTPRQEDNFWNKVNRSGLSGCWEWTGAKTWGYGVININNRPTGAHRVSFQIHYRLLLKGECACHRCDNPACVNPSHLFAGTDKINADDREAKGRTVRGSRMKTSKLTEAQVAIILDNAKERRIPQSILAKRFGVDQSTISDIIRGKRWGHMQQQLQPS